MKVKEQVMRWVFAATAAFSIAAVALICVFSVSERTAVLYEI